MSDQHVNATSVGLAVPGVTATGALIAGLTLPEWVCIVTIACTILSFLIGAGYTIWKWRRDIVAKAEDDHRPPGRWPQDE